VLRFLRRFSTQNTPMFCCGGGNATATATAPKCDNKDRSGCLPKFMTFTSFALPPAFSGRIGGPEIAVAMK
jgi:hypothetical protein